MRRLTAQGISRSEMLRSPPPPPTPPPTPSSPSGTGWKLTSSSSKTWTKYTPKSIFSQKGVRAGKSKAVRSQLRQSRGVLKRQPSGALETKGKRVAKGRPEPGDIRGKRVAKGRPGMREPDDVRQGRALRDMPRGKQVARGRMRFEGYQRPGNLSGIFANWDWA